MTTPKSLPIDDVLLTLFHSYDARGNQLAIDEAQAALLQLALECVPPYTPQKELERQYRETEELDFDDYCVMAGRTETCIEMETRIRERFGGAS